MKNHQLDQRILINWLLKMPVILCIALNVAHYDLSNSLSVLSDSEMIR